MIILIKGYHDGAMVPIILKNVGAMALAYHI